jgi:coenzyme F420-reducing hydrogenase delta subunit
VDRIHLMKAFELGADGVYVAGCLDGDCHFKNGNLRAEQRVGFIREKLEEIGLEPERLEMVKMSAGMGDRFAEHARDFTARIRALGPSPVRPRAKQATG